MVSRETKMEYLEKILQHSEFQAESYQKLLRFLVECETEDRQVNEMLLAMEVFNRGSDFDPTEDSIVRVYMSNLRKKLKQYYLTDGKGDEIRIQIPTGHYNLQFVKKEAKKENTSPSRKRTVLLALLLILLSGITGYLLNENIDSGESITNPLWPEFFDQIDNPTLLVIGDYFFISGSEEIDHSTFLRSGRINNPDAFADSVESNPSLWGSHRALSHTYLGRGSVYSLVELFPVLHKIPNQIRLKLASELTWEDINSHNMIFIGAVKQLYIIENLLSRIHLEYNLYPPRLIYREEGKQPKEFTCAIWSGNEGDYQEDYAVISRLKGPNDHNILLISGFSEASLIEGTKTCANPDLVTLLEDRFPINGLPQQFVMILRIEGFPREQVTFQKEIVFFQDLGEKSIPDAG